MRILLDPAPAPGGAAAAPPFVPAGPQSAPAPPQPQGQPQPQPAAPAAPANVPLPADEVSRLYGIARQFETFQAERQAAIDAETLKASMALAQKGEVEKAFHDYKAAQDTRVATLQTTLLNRERDLTISTTLAGVAFASDDAARDARELLGLRVEAALGGDGNPVVRDKATGRPAADTIREWLASPAAAHYLKPPTTGGAGATGGHVPAPAAPRGTDPMAFLGTAEQRAAGQYAGFGLVPRPTQ